MDKEVLAGQAVYNKFTLSLYDFWVIGISNYFIWKCPSIQILEFYNKNITANHLDIGVGTGFFLDTCSFPVKEPQLALMDLNICSLETAARRLKRYKPEIYLNNVLEPVRVKDRKFDSVGLNYLFHCLPGTMEQKGIVFQNIKPVLKNGTVVFGSTILTEGVKRSSWAKWLMRFYNAKAIFSNQNDSLEDLRNNLELNFSRVNLEVIGCVVLFSGVYKDIPDIIGS